MSRTSSQLNSSEIRCSCGKCLAKPNGIKCRCGKKNSIIHFYPDSALSGGTIERDWRWHLERAAIVGCDLCGIPGIEPTVPYLGTDTDARFKEYQERERQVSQSAYKSGP
jgi:hypothetical protein